MLGHKKEWKQCECTTHVREDKALSIYTYLYVNIHVTGTYFYINWWKCVCPGGRVGKMISHILRSFHGYFMPPLFPRGNLPVPVSLLIPHLARTFFLSFPRIHDCQPLGLATRRTRERSAWLKSKRFSFWFIRSPKNPHTIGHMGFADVCGNRVPRDEIFLAKSSQFSSSMSSRVKFLSLLFCGPKTRQRKICQF